MAALIAYQLLLAAGAPLGRAAWGGTHQNLPTGLRIASIATVAIYVVAALLLLRRSGVRVVGVSDVVARRGTWLLVAVFALSALADLASQSAWERWLMAPVALTLAVLSVVIASARR